MIANSINVAMDRPHARIVTLEHRENNVPDMLTAANKGLGLGVSCERGVGQDHAPEAPHSLDQCGSKGRHVIAIPR